MATGAVSKTRTEEFNRLLVQQATVTQSMKYDPSVGKGKDWPVIQQRAARLVELAELMGYADPEAYVNERIAAWLRMNPLALTNQMLLERVQETTKTYNPDTGNVCGVTVQIGEGDHAYGYAVMADDLAAVRGGGRVIFRVPESVAEFFRQQGRRQLKREFAKLMELG